METARHVVQTPMWVFGLRVGQAVLALILIGLSGAVSGGYAVGDFIGMTIACSVFTWLIVAYALVTEKVTSLNKLYIVFAVLGLDGFMCILWLAAWALAADRRSGWGRISAYYGDYYSNWNNILGMTAGIAALGAFIWISFIATFVWTLLQYLRGAKEGRFALGGNQNEAHAMEEAKAQQQQPAQAQPQYAQQPQQYQQPQQEQQYPPVAVPGSHQ